MYWLTTREGGKDPGVLVDTQGGRKIPWCTGGRQEGGLPARDPARDPPQEALMHAQGVRYMQAAVDRRHSHDQNFIHDYLILDYLKAGIFRGF